MTPSRLYILTCVFILAIGQVLFKQVAVNYNRTGALFTFNVLGILLIAGVLYIAATGLWVWTLRSVAISRAYPFFAFGFVLVPLLGAWLFGETLTLKYGAGIILIISGIIVAGLS